MAIDYGVYDEFMSAVGKNLWYLLDKGGFIDKQRMESDEDYFDHVMQMHTSCMVKTAADFNDIVIKASEKEG